MEQAVSVSTPGLTLYLRGGTYTGNFTSTNVGAAGNPVIIRNYPGEHPIISGKLSLAGTYSRWIGLDICQLDFTDRESSQASTDPTDIAGDTLVDISGDYIEVVNCFVHDGRRGFSINAGAEGTIVYGNLIYFTGWKNPANFYGHGIYPQNNPGVKKEIVNNILFDGFGYGLHIYGEAGARDDFFIQGNTFFDAGILVDGTLRSVNALVGGSAPFSNPEVYNNRFYMSHNYWGTNLQVGYGIDNLVTNAKINNNYMVGAPAQLKLITCVPTQMEGNGIFGVYEGFNSGDYPNNTYGAFGDWSDQVFLEANDYDANRATLTIYNKIESNTVAANVSSIFNIGDTIDVHNVQDYWTDIQELTVAGDGTITINMQASNRTVATPIGWTAPIKTFPKFGAFILIKQ